MKFILSVASRYLFARKSQNIINVISLISVIGVVTGTIALIIVLSVFNGLHGLIGNMFSSFDPELTVLPVEGKVFSLDSMDVEALHNIEGISFVSEILEDNALIKYREKEVPGVILGVDTIYRYISGLDSIIVEGSYALKDKNEPKCVLGAILADQLSLRISFVAPIILYAPTRTHKIDLMNPQRSFKSEYMFPAGVFGVRQAEYDSKYVIVNIEAARRLFEYDSTTVSSLGVKTDAHHDIEDVKHHLQETLGEHYLVKNREELHSTFYRMMKVEKMMAYLILTFILVIATFNIIGTLSMLIFDKKESIQTIKSMGADKRMVIRIFLFEGWMITIVGVVLGLILGCVLVLLQSHFGFVKFYGAGQFVVDAYPVKLHLTDVLMVFFTVATIGVLAAWYPVRVIVSRYYSSMAE